MHLLHAHPPADADIWHGIWDEILLHGLLDTLKLIPFLFLTYLLMEFIEHRASAGAQRFMNRAGALGPLVGGALGILPQCGFSAAASNLYTGRVVTLGTLIAVFLSTSDEMLPILISGNIPAGSIALILGYKAAVAVLVGFLVDLFLRLTRREREPINIDELCENDNCHCERGILWSALHHTLTISGFVLLITVGINALVYFVGEENLGAIMYGVPVIGHLIAAVFGLIPNCAASVALTTLAAEGIITVGTMMAGLFSGAGIGLLVLFRVNKHLKENLLVLAVLVVSGLVFGLVFDLIAPAELLKAAASAI